MFCVIGAKNVFIVLWKPYLYFIVQQYNSLMCTLICSNVDASGSYSAIHFADTQFDSLIAFTGWTRSFTSYHIQLTKTRKYLFSALCSEWRCMSSGHLVVSQRGFLKSTTQLGLASIKCGMLLCFANTAVKCKCCRETQMLLWYVVH